MLDAPLFYQLMFGELQLRGGEFGAAYEVMLDAARRSKDDSLFRRATEIALNARAGEQALAATRAWRQATPNSVEALQMQVQILFALNRSADATQPLREWIGLVPADQRPDLIDALPRLTQRVGDRKIAAQVLEQALAPQRDLPATRNNVRVALGRAWLAAGESGKALELARQVQADAPDSPAGALLALEVMTVAPEAERIVTDHLARPKAEPDTRLAYVRLLTQAQRYSEAVAQLERVTRERPTLPQPWLSLGALQLELRRVREAEAALQRYLQLSPATDSTAKAGDDEGPESAEERGRTQAWLLLAQAAEQRNDWKAAEAWLAKVESPQRALEVQSRRASLLARRGQLREARELIRRTPERSAEDARSKALAESQLLRDSKRWREAAEVLSQANARFTDDADLLYEQAMVEDKLERYAEMEKLLRQVIKLKPDHAHAHNALGYSLADRNLRLTEAKQLIQRALDITPGDPFITDSMGWIEFRLGNREEALRLLRKAYAARPDAEIATHLGEVLWSMGQREEAKRLWAEARGRDAGNDVLRETLARLKVNL